MTWASLLLLLCLVDPLIRTGASDQVENHVDFIFSNTVYVCTCSVGVSFSKGEHLIWCPGFFRIQHVALFLREEKDLWQERTNDNKGYGRCLWDSIAGLWGQTWVQRWWWGLQTPLLLDTSAISLWPLPAGGRLISLNHISLEGVTFSEAAEVMQSSPEEVQLIISQPKGAVCVCVCVCNDTVTMPSFVLNN